MLPSGLLIPGPLAGPLKSDIREILGAQREPAATAGQSDEVIDALVTARNAIDSLVLTPGRLRDAGNERGLSLASVASPPAELLRVIHTETDSNQETPTQQEPNANAINSSDTVAFVPTRRRSPDVRKMMAHLAEVFLEKVREKYPQAPLGDGWQRNLAAELRHDASVSMNQPMISKITSFLDETSKPRKIGIDVIVKVSNYTGVSIEALLGLEPRATDLRAGRDELLEETLRRLAALEAAIQTDSGTRKKR